LRGAHLCVSVRRLETRGWREASAPPQVFLNRPGAFLQSPKQPIFLRNSAVFLFHGCLKFFSGVVGYFARVSQESDLAYLHQQKIFETCMV
jgi:hypothetical protein